MKMRLSKVVVSALLCSVSLQAQTPGPPVPAPAAGTYLVWDQPALSVAEAQSYKYKVFADAEIASTTAAGTLLTNVQCSMASVVPVAGRPSPDPSYVPQVTSIIDTTLAIWTIGNDRQILRNGAPISGGAGTAIYWTKGTVYVLADVWYQWVASPPAWKPVALIVSVRCSTPFPLSSVGVQHSLALTTSNDAGSSPKSVSYTYTVKQTPASVPLKLRTLERK